MEIIKDVMVKMQKYKHMRRFLLYGEMYMNTLQTFAQMDETDGIEGFLKIQQNFCVISLFENK